MFDDLPILLLRFFVLTVSLTVHEAAHAWVAFRLGDETAKRMGRLSLNPLVHMDPLGSLMILSSMPLGWAKPVPVNPLNIRNPRSGLPLVAFAGPLSNLLLALAGCIVHFLLGAALVGSGWYTMLAWFIIVNFSLAIFNLLPIMPLDGSKIITAFMSDKVADAYEAKMAQLGIFPLIAIVAFEALGNHQGVIALWFRLWKPLIYPILALFGVPAGFYPG
ncbi:MAG TPA: site-2 protease family protein [Fibrobacteria bacterium]|nr:site-2 protease family protein [Fibrobacteria bacterium]